MTSRSSRTSSTSSTKSSRTYCQQIKNVQGKTNFLLHPSSVTDRPTLNFVIENVTGHMETCKMSCIPQSRTYFILANAYFTKFLLDMNDFRQIALRQEELHCKDFMVSIRDTSSSRTGHVVSSFKSPSNTRLDSNVLSHINNLNQQAVLLEPLLKSLQFWEKGLAAKNASTDCSPYHVHEHLLSAFQIFRCYKMILQQNECAKLASNMTCVNCVESLSTCIMNLSIALDTADMERAARLVKKGDSLVEETLQLSNGTPTFETIQFFTLKCDYYLRIGQMKQVSSDLKKLITSEYFQKSTVNRFYLKALALYTASKFPGDSYEYSASLEEFTEPLFMSFTVIRTWNQTICNFDCQDTVKVVKPHEPIWFQYAMYSIFLTSYELFARFNSNNENPLEVEYFHNFSLSICRQNCFLYWTRKILILGALVDWLTDKPDHALSKLNISMDFFKSKNRTNLLTNQSSESQIETEGAGDDDSDDTFTIQTRLHSSPSEGNENECLHNREVSVYSLKKTALSIVGDEDESFAASFDMEKILKSDPEECEVYEADSVRLEGLILLILLKYSVPRDRISFLTKLPITNSIKNSLLLVRNVAKSVDRPDAKTLNLVRKELLECTRDLLTVRLRVWINCIHISSFEMAGDRTKALSIASSIFNKSFAYRIDCFEGYSSRMQFAELCSLYSRLLLESPFPFAEYDPAAVEELVLRSTSCASLVISERSSSPPAAERRCRSRKLVPPLAPNGKNNKMYKVPELDDYYKKLGQVVVQEKSVPRLPSQYTESPVVRYKQFLDQLSPTPPSEFEKAARPAVVKAEPKSQTAKKKCQVEIGSATLKTESSSVELSSALDSLTLTDSNKCQHILTIISQLITEGKTNVRVCDFLLKYLSSHPPAPIYRSIHHQIAIQMMRLDQSTAAAHHLSEMAAVAFRYHALRVSNKRLTKKKKVSAKVSEVSFVHSNGPTSVEECLKDCPPAWRMVQVCIDGNDKPGPGLLIVRYQKDTEPVIVRIKSVPQKHQKNFMSDLVEILELSNNSIIDKDPETFWKVRKALDLRLKQLMQSVELAWLGPWKGLFIGSIRSPRYHELVKALVEEIIANGQELNYSFNNGPLLPVLVECIPIYTKDDFRSGMALIMEPFNITLCDQLYSKCRGAFEEEFNLAELDQLITDLKSSPVGLILGTGLDLLPWECLPTALSLEQQFFRIPSLRFLSLMVKQWKHLLPSPESTYYLLNPANNLHKTQSKFEEKFKQMKGWTGSIGTQPSANDLLTGLEKCHIYIFFGHGAGSCYYRKLPSNLEGVDVNTISLVIGCSSGRLRQDGKKLEPTGTPYRFILNGAPSYVGILWDVTDIDIDAYSDSMLSYWLPGWGDKRRTNDKSNVLSLSAAATKARQACKLKYIIGAAPVVYGLPLACENVLDKIK